MFVITFTALRVCMCANVEIKSFSSAEKKIKLREKLSRAPSF